MVSDEERHFLAHLSAPCLKPWGLSCHWRIWTAVKIPKPVFLLGLPTLNKFLWFYWLQGNAPDRCPCKWCQTCTGLIVTSKLSRNSFTWDAGDWQHEPCGHVPAVLSWRHISFGGQSLRESQLWDLGSNRRSALCSFSFSFTVKRGPASFFFFSSIVQVTGYRAGNVDVCFRVPLERRPQEGVRDVLRASILTAWHQDKGSEHLLLPKPLCPEDPEAVVLSKYWRSPIFFLPLQFVAQGLVR